MKYRSSNLAAHPLRVGLHHHMALKMRAIFKFLDRLESLAATCQRLFFVRSRCRRPVTVSRCAAVCGNTARMLPTAFSCFCFLQQLNGVRLQHRVTLPQPRVTGVQRAPGLGVALHFLGGDIGRDVPASCGAAPFPGNAVERTPPSARISPVSCAKMMLAACVSVEASRTTACPVNRHASGRRALRQRCRPGRCVLLL